MTEIILVVVAAIAFWVFKSSKKSSYPNRLFEIEQALKTHAALRLHRNKDTETSDELTRLAEDLKRAQHLVNESHESVRENWGRIRPQMLHLTSEQVLTKVDLYYSDRREELKAAVNDLVGRLDKIEHQASQPSSHR